MKTPRVSVVVATHNRPRLLERAVASLQRQTFADFEIVLVDDGSEEPTQKLIDRLCSCDRRIRAFRTADSVGPAGARNLGVKKARADLVAVLDDDDVSRPDRVEKQVSLLDSRPEVDLVCSAVEWIDQMGETLGYWPGAIRRGALPEDPRGLFELLYLENNKIPNTTLMLRAEWLRRFPYAEDLRVGEDWFCCMQMVASGARVVGISEPLVRQQRDASHSSLMAGKTRAFSDQRKALKKIRSWLDSEGIRDFEGLHRRAWVNQLLREASFWGGTRGLSLVLRALARRPTSSRAWRVARTISEKAIGRIRRVLGPGREPSR